MKECKRKKIKGFHKKSVWPSIVLFLLFIVACVAVVGAFLTFFTAFLEDSKIMALSGDAEQIGRMIIARMENSPATVSDAVSFVENYLEDDNDICVTDEYGKIIMSTGDTVPNFEFVTMVTGSIDGFMKGAEAATGEDWSEQVAGLGINTKLVYADSGMSDIMDISLEKLWRQAVKPAIGTDLTQEQEWLRETVFSTNCWVEIPMKSDRINGYQLYYKGTISLIRREVLYLFIICVLTIPVLLVPILLLFINVLSSIVMQKRMVRLLYLDTITGGRNWTYFVLQCKKLLCRIWNAGNTYFMVNLHMNRYQDYCTCYGGRAGEELLENIDGFLQAKTVKGEVFARFATADFGLLLNGGSMEICEKRLKAMLAELKGIQKERKIGFHVGICLIPPVNNRNRQEMRERRQIDIDQLYHYANAAREDIHGKEGQYIGVFDKKILEEQLWKRNVEDTMETALHNKEFQLYLQPKYNPAIGKIVGAEALVRWISPTEGMITPNRFIPIFEENGFITKLDDYMIASVAKLQAEWKLQGKKRIPVSVNVSRAHFTREDLAEHISHLVDSYGADHAYIELEVTESAFFGNKDILQQTIRELKQYGFHISMDDFGAGYSSLNSLKDLPIDVLKLDMDFFRGEDVEKRGEIVVRETIQLAKNLNMKVVAEGIEKKEQVDFLAAHGCDMIQGFYYAKPMPVSEFDERVAQEWS